MTDPSTYKLNHTMLRVKDPARSIAFYTHLGMRQIHKIPNPSAKFDLYFLGYAGANSASADSQHFTDREGLIELTHNYGTEEDAGFEVATGNKEPKGFGHTCISVDNIQAACARIEEAGYTFQKRLSDGKMRSIAFVLDPDGYWVEVIGQKSVEEAEKEESTDVGSYRMNHTMIRVKDADVSLKFYQEVMGMRLLRTSENASAGFNLYFLAYGPPANASSNATNPGSAREGILELTWNYGTEKESGPQYHNGNDTTFNGKDVPQGFGHVCVSVDDLGKACERFEEKGASWKKRLSDGRMKNIAFLLDPDGYWIEVVQNARLGSSNL